MILDHIILFFRPTNGVNRNELRPHRHCSTRFAAISPVRKRSSGIPSTPSVVTTISPYSPSGTGRLSSPIISTIISSGCTCPPRPYLHSENVAPISVDEYVAKSSTSHFLFMELPNRFNEKGGSRRPFFQRRAGGRNYGLFGGSIFPMALSVSASKKILVLISYFYTKKYFLL